MNVKGLLSLYIFKGAIMISYYYYLSNDTGKSRRLAADSALRS